MNNSTVNIQLTPDQISVIANSLSYELFTVPNKDSDSEYKEELKELYNKFSNLEDQI